MKLKVKIYFSIMILVCLLIAMVMSSIAWFTVNLEVQSSQVTLTASSSLGLNISIPQDYENGDSYMGQTGLQYEGLDSPYILAYNPVTINAEISQDKEYYLFSSITSAQVETVMDENPMVLSQEDITDNFTWRYGIMRRVTGINPDTGLEEQYYVEKFYKNNNGFLYDIETGQPFRIYEEQVYSLKLYLVFLGEEGYSLLQTTQADISEDYKFEYSDISYMWATFTITINLGMRELYTVSFNSMGGEDCRPIPTTGGESLTLPTPTIEDETKYFGAWYDNALGEGEEFESDTLVYQPIQNDITLYAKWLDKAKLSFDNNGYPEAMPSSQYIIPGQTGYEPEMEETVYWTTSPMSWEDYMSDPQPFNFDTPINEDTTLYLVWQPRYTITLHMNTNYSGYLVVEEVEYHDTYTFVIYEGETIPDIYTPEPNSSYLEFKKWSLNSSAASHSFASSYDFSQVIYEDTHLYAYYGL